MKALHFGAGNIGRGFIGQLLTTSGFLLTFSDIDQTVIDSINFYHGYNIEVIDQQHSYTKKIRGVQAINVSNPNLIIKIAEVDIITISVGIDKIYSLAKIIVRGIKYRIEIGNVKFLNIIACENSFRCSSELKNKILNVLPKKYHQYLKNTVGFVDSVVDRIVCSSCNKKEKDILLVKVERFREWIVDKTQFKGDIPNIFDMKLSNNLDAFFERKLFTLNTGHVMTAYLGLLNGYKTVYRAILDRSIHAIVYGAMKESGKVLIAKYKFNKLEHNNYIETILSRFKNPNLTDDLTRVGRNPLQKLKKNDRLLGPIFGTLKYNLPNLNLAQGVASALCYYNNDDSQSIKLCSLLHDKGIKYTLSKVSDLDPNLSIVTIISMYFNKFYNLIG